MMPGNTSSLIRDPEGVDLVVVEGHLDRRTVLETAEWLAAYRRQHDQAEDLERALNIVRRASEPTRSSPENMIRGDG
jgi:hypothetical protein